jgi:hypothetical protein
MPNLNHAGSSAESVRTSIGIVSPPDLCYRETNQEVDFLYPLSATWKRTKLHYNSSMPKLQGLGNIVTELRAERTHLVNNLRHVDAALAVLGKLEGGKFATESRRSVSASARRKIAAAQKAPWTRVRSQTQTATSAKTNVLTLKRTPSAAARRKMALAQRARWAKFRAEQAKKAA